MAADDARRTGRASHPAALSAGEEPAPWAAGPRLSDLLFVLSRGANAGNESLWEPGRHRDVGSES
jgi:cob(I)alamin adenosyltransferase